MAKAEKVIELVAAAASAVAAAVAVADAPVVKDGIDVVKAHHAKKAEEKQALIKVPEIYASDFRLSLEEATHWLEEDGLKVRAALAKPNVAYREYAAMAVVRATPKPRQKVKPGTRVFLRYVNAEVIEASRTLFDEAERQKVDAKQKKADIRAEKAQKTAEQRAKSKQKLYNTVETIQQGLNDVALNAHKGVEKLLPKKRTDLAGTVQNSTGNVKKPLE